MAVDKRQCDAYQVNRRVPDFVCKLDAGHGGPHHHRDGTRWGGFVTMRNNQQAGGIPRGVRYPKRGNG